MSNLVPVSWRNSIEDLRDRVSGIFDRWAPTRTGDTLPNEGGLWAGGLFSHPLPAVDVEETDDEVRVSAELPGLEEKDFHVELDGQRLLLHGEKNASREEKKRNYYYAESAYGAFFRAVPLPCDVDRDKTRAQYKHGVLTVTMPKTEEAKARRLQVEVK
ncbi:MAG: Hsp20/alpha crystallin family protein [Candidatus Hydrogenedentota bacterium]